MKMTMLFMYILQEKAINEHNAASFSYEKNSPLRIVLIPSKHTAFLVVSCLSGIQCLSKDWISKILLLFFFVLKKPVLQRLHLFDQNYIQNCKIVKYYYSLNKSCNLIFRNIYFKYDDLLLEKHVLLISVKYCWIPIIVFVDTVIQ